MREPVFSENGKGYACKLRTDKKATDLSIGTVICDWRIDRKTNGTERQKETKLRTGLPTYSECISASLGLSGLHQRNSLHRFTFKKKWSLDKC